MSKKKILFITPTLRQGGVEHSLITTLNLLDPNKYDITLYLYVDMMDLLSKVPNYVKVIVGVDQTKYFRKPYSALCLFFYYILSFFNLKKVSNFFRNKMYEYIHKKKVDYPYRKYFKKESFDIVISYCLHIGTEMGLYIQARKYCVFMHNSDPDYHHYIAEKTFMKYNVIACVSYGVLHVMAEAFPSYADKMIVIENYVDAKEIIELANEDILISKNTYPIIVSCGRLSKEKGFDLAVKSAVLLKSTNTNFHWFFIGDGDQRNTLEKLIKEYKLDENITITGFVDNPYPYIKACDIFVHPSYEESFGLTIKEAVILRKKIISTDTIGAETVLKNGLYGWLVPISSQGITSGILNLLRYNENKQIYTLSDNLHERNKFISAIESLIEN